MSYLTSLLVRDQVVPVKKIEEALQRQVVSGGDITTVLLEGDAVSENALASYCAALFAGIPVSRHEILHISRDVLRLVSRDLAERYRCVPLSQQNDSICLVVSEPLEARERESLQALLGHPIEFRIACDVRVRGALQQYYDIAVSPRQRRLLEKLAHRDEGEILRIEHAQDPVKRLTISPPQNNAPSEPPNLTAGPSEPPPPLKLSRKRTANDDAPREAQLKDAWSSEESLQDALGFDGVPTTQMNLPRETRASAAIRKLRGPLTREAAQELLQTVRERDEIVEIFFAFAKQFFDYAALFVVHDDVADGRDAFGPGASSDEVQRIAVPLDIPGSFSLARETGLPWIGRVEQSELDRIVMEDLNRTGRDPAIVLPLAIRSRTVLLLYGDQSGEEFSLASLAPLIGFVPRVVETFENMIVRRKRTLGFGAASAPPPRPKTPVPPHARRSDPVLGSPSPATVSRPAPKTASHAPITGRTISFAPPQRASLPPAPPPLPSEDSGGSLQRALLQAGASDNTAVRGAPNMPLRSSPDDMPAPTSSPRHSDRPRVPTLQQALGIGPSAPPPPRSRVSSPGFVAAESPLKDDVFDRPTTPPPSGFAGDEMEDDFGANDHTHDMAAEPTVASSWKPLGWQNPDPPAVHDVGAEKTKIRDWAPSEDVPLDAPAAPAIESLALAEARRELDSNSEEPRSKQDNSPEANSIAPPTAQKKSASVYVMKSEAVDDLGAPEPRPSRAPVTHVDHAKSRVKNVDPRREDRSSLPPEIVRGSESILPPMFNTNEAETRSDDATGNVIVDMGDAVTQLAKELMRQGPEDEGAILQALMRHGEAPLPVLAQAFPGPLWFSRHSVYRKLPRGRDVSAVARALYAYRERSVPYVASLLESNIPDRRFYAAMLAGDLSHQGLVTALMVRVFDDDDGVRALALELLPRCRGFPEVFAEGLALIRRALRVRSKDPFRRLLAVYACGVLRDVESVPDLIDALDEARELKDNEFLRTVQRALVEITAEDLGQHPKKWFDWWEKNKSRDRVEWLIDGLAHSEEWLRGLAFEELKSTTQQYFGYQPNAPRKEREVAAQKYRKWFEENAGARPA